MSDPVAGLEGSGQVIVYTSPLAQAFVLEAISFQVDTDATAGVHTVLVELVDRSVGVVFSCLDRNAAGPSQSNRYSYALGGTSSSCPVPGGWALVGPLPWTTLQPEASVVLTAVDDTGTLIAGDAFTDVNLMASFVEAVGPADPFGAASPTMFVPASAAMI